MAGEKVASEIKRLLGCFQFGTMGVACLEPDGNLLAANPSFCEMSGRTEQELSGTHIVDLTHPEDREGYRDLLGGLADGSVPSLERRGRYLRGGRDPIWVESHVSAMKDELGNPEYLIVWAQDITERVAAEDQNAQLFGFPLALVFIAGLDGYFRRVGAGYERLLGWSDEELLSRPFFDFVHPDDLGALGASIQEVTAGRTEVINQEIRILCKDGSYRWLMGNYRPVLDEGVMYGMAVDITARKDAAEALRVAKADAERARKEAERANRAKSEFLSHMSHELRTPLNAILGFAQLLEIEELDTEQRDSVEQIITGGRRLLELITEVLDISRIEAGRLRLSLEPVRVADVVRESVDLLRSLAAERNIELRAELPPDISDQHVSADRQRLGQVLLNLLSNGVKYNVEGGSVTVVCPRIDRERMRIGVRDTGPGVEQEKVPLLFTPFERLGAEQTAVEGAGLGLSLCKSLVEAMGGTISVETIIGEGTTFWVELEATASPAAEEVAEPAKRVVRTPSSIVRTVLYVEDNLSNLKLVERILAHRSNLELISAMTADLGLQLARQHRPDLILLDLHLPDLRGDETLLRLRRDPKTSNIPVVVLSAEATPGEIKRLLAAGAEDYLTKPLDVAAFLGVLDRLLEQPGVQP